MDKAYVHVSIKYTRFVNYCNQINNNKIILNDSISCDGRVVKDKAYVHVSIK